MRSGLFVTGRAVDLAGEKQAWKALEPWRGLRAPNRDTISAVAPEAIRKRFAAVKPLLSKELGHAFDPGVFGCDTTGADLDGATF